MVFIDPPWGGASAEDAREQQLYMYKTNTFRHTGRDIRMTSHAWMHDLSFGCLHIVKTLLKQNKGVNKEQPTQMVVIKTPNWWNTAMLDEIKNICTGAKIKPCKKVDYHIFFLCPDESISKHPGPLSDEDLLDMQFNQQGQNYGFCDMWYTQQRELENMFTSLKDFKIGHKTPKTNKAGEVMKTKEGKVIRTDEVKFPIFLQNLWPTGVIKDNVVVGGVNEPPQKGEKIPNTMPYVPGALHDHTNLHCGEKKLLINSLFTITWGLKRIQKAMKESRRKQNSYIRSHNYAHKTNMKKKLPEINWSDIMDNTIVLYVGAAGLKPETHHFNELLKLIPNVHFVCYDIRHVETKLDEVYKERMTIFHKIFTHNDMERWVAFSAKYTDKSIIFISDIRSDWQQAMLEIQASKNILCRKMVQLNLKAKEETVGIEAQTEFIETHKIRAEIDQLFNENRAAASWIDEVVKNDSYVQWKWCKALCSDERRKVYKDKTTGTLKYAEATTTSTTIAIFSVKTREAYQTAAATHRGLKDYYYHLEGCELLSPDGPMGTTETRTQVTT